MRRMKCYPAFTLAFALMLALSGCSGAVLDDGPGQGKWRNSNITGSVQAEETIRLQDDFAAAADQELIAGAESGTGSFMTVMKTVLDKKQKLLEGDLSGDKAGELKKFADLAGDWDSRNADGAEPLRPYLEAIEEISSMEDLTAYVCDTGKNPFCLGILMPGATMQSQTDPTVANMMVSAPQLTLGDPAEYFALDETGLERRAYINGITGHVLTELGYQEGEIDRLLKACYRFEKKLAGADVILAQDEAEKMLLTFTDCVSAADGYPMENILRAWGCPEDGRYFMNTKAAAKAASLYTEQNLDGIRSMLIVHTAVKAAHFLDRETFALEKSLSESRLNAEPEELPYTDEEKEQMILFDDYIAKSAAGPILDELYVDRYVDDDVISDLEKLTQDVISQYHVLFSEEPWLTEEGKTLCLEKLDAIEAHVMIPDFDLVDYEGFRIVPRSEGGTFLDAVMESQRCLMRHNAARCARPYDRSKWDPTEVSTTMTNAFYMPTTNGIYILAGAAEAPIYSLNMSYEQKLGGICAIIGHEITHGFDSSGARYDKDGLQNTWLPVQDSMTFADRCDRVTQYYSTIRPFAGGSVYNGSMVTGEATADMGGIRITLDLARSHSGFDYDAYFRQFAAIWAESVPEDILINNFQTDVHPLNYLRVNVGLQQFEEFYETYGIAEGDGMYLSADRRIAVW